MARTQFIDKLSRDLIHPDATPAAKRIDALYAGGIAIKSIHLDHLAPAAEMLGDWWDDDKIGFTNVTVGTGRIYAIIRNLAHRFPHGRPLSARSALFSTIPGDDHTLGVRSVAELARKEGWDIDLLLPDTLDELLDRIVKPDHLIIGLSCGSKDALPELARVVLAIHVSQPAARLLVSGSLAHHARKPLELMQIDAIETEFDAVLAALNRLWSDFSAV